MSKPKTKCLYPASIETGNLDYGTIARTTATTERVRPYSWINVARLFHGFGFIFFSVRQTYTINTFLTHQWVVMLNGAEVKKWVVSERQEKQSFVLSKADLE